MPGSAAKLLIADSESNSDMFWATRFFVPDPFIYLKVRGRSIIIVSDLEYGRAKKEAAVDRILSLSEHMKKIEKRDGTRPSEIDVIRMVLKERGIRRVIVPHYFPLDKARRLEAAGLKVETKPDPFFDERAIKSREERAAIRHTLSCVSHSLKAATDLLKKARIRGGRVLAGGRPLTCKHLRDAIDGTLYQCGCLARHTIVACGRESADPHAEGRGPILPHSPIVLDIFPKDMKSGYYGDMTRTVVKGRAPDRLRKMYRAVLDAQITGIRKIRAGVAGASVHRTVEKVIARHGFKTGPVDGTPQGFIHSTGHGLGLDVHEPPRISREAGPLRAGAVVSVEPGLYYKDIGGVRIEDIVFVTRGGCEVLSRFPKVLEIP